MSTWNYRVIKQISHGETMCGIHEVYYSNDGALKSYTVNPVTVAWEDGEDGKEVLAMMLRALDKPVLTDKDFDK